MRWNIFRFAFFAIAQAALLLNTGAAHGKESAAPAQDIVALDPNYRGRWEVHSGKWNFEQDALVGAGDSAMDFNGPFETPFTLRFRMKVISGERVRVKVGTVTLANEGSLRTLQVTAHGAHFGYALKREYQITMEVKADGVDVSVDGAKVLSTAQVVGAVPAITFRSGDYWSKGEVRFSDIVVEQSKVPGRPSLAEEDESPVKVLSKQAPNALEWALAPLNRTVPGDIRENLTLLRENLLDEGAKKGAANAEAYKLGRELCNELIGTLNERDKALARAGYTAAQAQANIRVTNQALEARRRFTRWPTYFREVDQREELRKEKENGAALVNQRPVLEWAERGAQIRGMVDALYAQFREAARQPGVLK